GCGDLYPQAGGTEGRGRTLDEVEGYALLDRLGIPCAPSTALDVNVTHAPALLFGYPVALKVLSSAIAHKSDIGGVMLGIPDAPALVAAIAAMRTRLPQVGRGLVPATYRGIGGGLTGDRDEADGGAVVPLAAAGTHTERVLA